MIGNVIVGYDGHEPAHDALALGAAFARAGGGELLAACISEEEQRWTSYDRDHQRRRIDRLQALSADVKARQPELAARDAIDTIAVPARTAAEGLHDIAADEGSSLVVVGSTHRGPAGRVLPGTTAGRLLDHAACAVAVAPRGFALRPGPMRAVGVGIDGSEASDDALAAARSLAHALGARLVALSAVREGRGSREPRLRANGDGGVPVERLTLTGSLAAALARAAADLDLLVLGSHLPGPGRLLPSASVSRELLDRCPTAVVVVPQGMATSLAGHSVARSG